MRSRELGCVFVVDADHKLIGMFTESMLTQQLAHGKALLDEPIKSHMSDHWPWVQMADPIADVLEAMNVNNTRFICVVDKDGRAAALTGQKGLMEYIADHFPSQVMVQRIGCSPTLDREGA
jgi:predicted transcriptional regulator